eukprot:SAG31_NODE_119_length_23948_cov_9.957105_17_plen_481_part_00
MLPLPVDTHYAPYMIKPGGEFQDGNVSQWFRRLEFARREGWLHRAIPCLGMLFGKSKLNPTGWTQQELRSAAQQFKEIFPEMPGIGFYGAPPGNRSNSGNRFPNGSPGSVDVNDASTLELIAFANRLAKELWPDPPAGPSNDQEPLVPEASAGDDPVTMYIRPDGDDAAYGTTLATAWRSIDRGQPTQTRADAAADATTILVRRAGQFPLNGTVTVIARGVERRLSYSSRNFSALHGVKWLTAPVALPKGSVVHSVEWPAPRGRILSVAPGVYPGPARWPTEDTAEPGVTYEAVVITAGSAPRPRSATVAPPLRVRGPPADGPPAIIDGRDLSKVAISIWGAEGVELSGLEVRRGSVYTFEAKRVNISSCKIHLGTVGLEFAYSDLVSAERNLIYDIFSNGVGTATIIEQGDGTDTVAIHHNTLAASDRCMRVTGTHPHLRPNVTIHHNVSKPRILTRAAPVHNVLPCCPRCPSQTFAVS